MKADPSYAQYAYVTQEDLKNLKLLKRSEMSEGPEDRNLLLAFQTPHGSLLDLY